eukprot:800445-Prymnesium_polylepis.1
MGVNSCGIADEVTFVQNVTVLHEAVDTIVEASPAEQPSMVVMEPRTDVAKASASWAQGARAPRDVNVDIYIQLAVTEAAHRKLDRILAGVSDPSSP